MSTRRAADHGRHRIPGDTRYRRPVLTLACVVACVAACTGGATAAGRLFGSHATRGRAAAVSPPPSTSSGPKRRSPAEPRATASPAESAASATSAPPSAQATASPAAQPTTSPGVSRTVSASELVPQVGAVFDSDGLNGSHYCTASVVNSPGEDVIVSAAHCLDSTSEVFVPGYHDGVAPYGVWHLQRIVTEKQWTDDSDPDADVAFAVVAPLGGRTVQSVVGGYDLGIDRSTSAQVTLTGYPGASEKPVTCTNQISSFSSTQNRIDCTGMTSGTSGSPWVTAGGPGTVMGVIGGYEQGGDTDDVSYSVAFGQDVASLYGQATSDGN